MQTFIQSSMHASWIAIVINNHTAAMSIYVDSHLLKCHPLWCIFGHHTVKIFQITSMPNKEESKGNCKTCVFLGHCFKHRVQQLTQLPITAVFFQFIYTYYCSTNLIDQPVSFVTNSMEAFWLMSCCPLQQETTIQ